MTELRRQLGLLDSTMINVGTIMGALTQNLLTLIKMGLLAVLILVGFVLPGGNVASFSPVWPDVPLAGLIAPFGMVTPLVFIAFATWLVGNTIVEQPATQPSGQR